MGAGGSVRAWGATNTLCVCATVMQDLMSIEKIHFQGLLIVQYLNTAKNPVKIKLFLSLQPTRINTVHVYTHVCTVAHCTCTLVTPTCIHVCTVKWIISGCVV